MNVAVFLALLLATFGASLAYGGAPERWMAVLVLTATLLSHLLYRTPAIRYYTVETSVALVDVGLLAGITLIMLRADRFWPIAIFATHGVTVLSHLVKALDASINRHAYVIAIAVPSYAALLILVAGVARHQQRVRRHGGDLDWSRSRSSERVSQ